MANLTTMKDNLKNLLNQQRTLLDAGVALSMQTDATAEALNLHRDQVATLQARIDLLRDAITQQEGMETPTQASGAAPADATNAEKVRAMRKSNEYARAFAKAVRLGVGPTMPCSDTSMTVLYDAMTIGGGTPAGADGGFLVPEDVQNTIIEVIRSLRPLRDLFNSETVTTVKGSRVMDNDVTKGFTKLDGELAEIPQDDKPTFGQVPYTVDTYALIIPLSNELVNNEAAGLFAYLGRWFARKQIITENGILTTLLNKLTAKTITPDDETNAVLQLRSMLNMALDPLISLNASILTNQDGFNYLDTLLDKNGRPLMTEDATSPTPRVFMGRPVMVMSNGRLPSRVTNGVNGGTYYPLYVGDMTQYATLFERQPLEMLSTNVGGDAFRRNGVEVRGITGLGASVFDTASTIRREIFIKA